MNNNPIDRPEPVITPIDATQAEDCACKIVRDYHEATINLNNLMVLMKDHLVEKDKRSKDVGEQGQPNKRRL